MQYNTPELRVLGTLSGLTLGMNGSCPDGGGRNNTQNSDGANAGGTPCSAADNSSD